MSVGHIVWLLDCWELSEIGRPYPELYFETLGVGDFSLCKVTWSSETCWGRNSGHFKIERKGLDVGELGLDCNSRYR